MGGLSPASGTDDFLVTQILRGGLGPLLFGGLGHLKPSFLKMTFTKKWKSNWEKSLHFVLMGGVLTVCSEEKGGLWTPRFLTLYTLSLFIF